MSLQWVVSIELRFLPGFIVMLMEIGGGGARTRLIEGKKNRDRRLHSLARYINSMKFNLLG